MSRKNGGYAQTCYECAECEAHMRVPEGVSLPALPYCEGCGRFLDESEPCSKMPSDDEGGVP